MTRPAPQAAAPRGSAQIELPATFGHYLLIERIGSGGMADVYKSVVFGTEGFRRVLVVKRIRAELSASPEFVRMFTDEARITALLDHPNIVQVYDFGQVDGIYFLAMEHLDGKDLSSVMRVLRPAGLSLRGSLVAQIALQVARGLHYAHTRRDAQDRPCQIIHRDINPANIMLLRTGGVKVLDFGIAKASAVVGKAQTQHAKLKGKLGYLSPEQARGEPLDGRSDVFSLGVTMWEMLTGHRLFAAKTDFERLRNVLHAPIDVPSARRPNIPAALDQIVMKALQRDRDQRYESAQAMADDLEAFVKTRRGRSDGIRQLLNELFGAPEPSSSGERTPFEGPGPHLALAAANNTGRVRLPTGATGVVTTGIHAMASGPLLLSGAGTTMTNAGTGTGSVVRPRAAAWTWQWVVVAALLVAGGGALSSLLHIGSGARPATFQGVPLTTVSSEGTPAGPTAAPAGAMIRVEVQSEPPGAAVTAGARALGVTPLTVTLPAGQPQQLRFEKDGYLRKTYDLHTTSDGLVFVELQRARAGE